ncbi:MAG: ATP-binding protein [Syntrophales bacterium]|nr:ATP-binding protein [Syntrophales bacterium]MDD5642024.1 ATP-binding protein [Syntrophales bacterium]
MESSSLPEAVKESQKRRRERILIILILLLVVAITSYEVYLVRQGGQPVTGSLLAFSLLNINTILLFLLTFLIFRHLAKLFLERRRRVFGSRLRTRLVLTFISLTLLPTLFLFFMAWQLISSRVDFSWGRQVEWHLEQALNQRKAFAQGMEEKLRAYGRLLSLELARPGRWRADQGSQQAFLAKELEAYQLSALELLDPSGKPLTVVSDPKAGELPRIPPPKSGAGEAMQKQPFKQGELLTFLAPVTGPGNMLEGYVAVRQFLPQALAGAEQSIRELRQMQLLLRPVRVSHYLTLVIVTLVAMFFAIWLALYMAREITTPIRQLAEGTLKVAGGDYDFQINQEGQESRDEIGFLVESFNKMTQDLQHSQAQLAAAYRELSASHTQLEARKRDMEILLKNVAAGVISIDAGGRLTTINDSAAQMLNWRREEVLGQDCRDLLPAKEFQRLAEVITAARNSPRGTVETPLHVALPDQTLYLLLKPTVLKDEAGQDLGVVIVFEDLTELERAQRLAAWREVARSIAHEVKNPLTPIKLAAQRLRRRYLENFQGDSQIFDECTQIIINQVDELKKLVNEFSRFARLPQLALAPQDFNALVQETLILYQEVKDRITLEFQPDPDLPILLLDREQMKRVLLNLMDNALAAIQGPGRIDISLKGDAAREMVELTVADTGSGIPERDRVRIFEPYFSTKRGGTGLGLAIVNSIVAEHHGQIRVENNLPQGTRVVIDIPMIRGDYASHAVSRG